jgi:hypothetical protein
MEQRVYDNIVVCDAVAGEGGWEERAPGGTTGVAAAMLDVRLTLRRRTLLRLENY